MLTFYWYTLNYFLGVIQTDIWRNMPPGISFLWRVTCRFYLVSWNTFCFNFTLFTKTTFLKFRKLSKKAFKRHFTVHLHLNWMVFLVDISVTARKERHIQTLISSIGCWVCGRNQLKLSSWLLKIHKFLVLSELWLILFNFRTFQGAIFFLSKQLDLEFQILTRTNRENHEQNLMEQLNLSGK